MELLIHDQKMTLEEVREDRLGDVIEALEQYLPFSIHVQSSVSVLKHYGLAAVLDRKVFTPRHPEYRHKMVVVTPVTTKRGVQSVQLFWSPSELQDEDVYLLLRSLPHFIWTESFFVRQLPELLHNQLSRVVTRLSGRRLQSSLVTRLLLYTFAGPVPEIPPSPGSEYILSGVRRSDYPLLLAHLSGSRVEDPTVMKSVFDKVPVVGVYKISVPDPGNDKMTAGATMQTLGDRTVHPTMEVVCDDTEHRVMELVSWSMVKHSGDLGNTFTVEAFRGKGLAQMATVHCMKQREEVGLQLCAGVELENEISKKLLTKLGFTFQFVTYILRYAEQNADN